ncbi:MAG: hypothetical protein J4N97_02985, partial [Chloroflexi bacterium]|nr:hypothetical protein [Chloroflexota bacterium]
MPGLPGRRTASSGHTRALITGRVCHCGGYGDPFDPFDPFDKLRAGKLRAGKPRMGRLRMGGSFVKLRRGLRMLGRIFQG